MKYDTIVIGSGSAGGIMATRLSEDAERSELLLEAGPDYPDFEHLPRLISQPGGWRGFQPEVREVHRFNRLANRRHGE